MNKKLLIFHAALAPYRVDLFNYLNDRFNTKTIFSKRNLCNQAFNQKLLLNQLHFTPIYLDKKISIKHRTFNWGYRKLIKKNIPDIVIGTEYNFSILIPYLYRFFSKNKYLIYSICDDNIEMVRNPTGIHKWMRNLLAPKIDGLILTNDEIAQWYKKKYLQMGKTIVFPIIQEDLRFRKKLEESISISKQYIKQYYLNNQKVFLFVGRLVNIKGIDKIIKAFSEANTDVNTRLVIVGEGPMNEALQAQVRSLNLTSKILFTGRLEDLNLLAWYNISGCFILASEFEPFGAVVNEALLAGIEVLCSSKAGASCLIKKRVNGDIFDPYNIKELSDLISTYNYKISPTKSEIEIKTSLMPFSFEEAIDRLIKAL